MPRHVFSPWPEIERQKQDNDVSNLTQYQASRIAFADVAALDSMNPTLPKYALMGCENDGKDKNTFSTSKTVCRFTGGCRDDCAARFMKALYIGAICSKRTNWMECF
jgi:hypothetical protein